MSDFFKGIDEMLAICRDPGILERRSKIDTIKLMGLTAELILGPLVMAAENGEDWKTAIAHVRSAIVEEVARYVADLEAIDKPMP